MMQKLFMGSEPSFLQNLRRRQQLRQKFGCESDAEMVEARPQGTLESNTQPHGPSSD